MPEEIQGDLTTTSMPGAADQVATQAAGAAAVGTEGTSLVGGAGTDTGAGGGGVGTGAAAPASTIQGWRDQLRTLGVDLSHVADDRQALTQIAQIYQSMPMLRQLAAIGEQVYPHLSEFQNWRQQQAQSRQQPATPASWWKKPEYDPRWQTQLTRDPATGQIVPVQGADPSIVGKYHQWMEHRQNFLDKFAQDPINAIEPGIKEIVASLVQPMLQQAMHVQQEAQNAQQLVSQHADWLHERDANGRYVTDAFGNKLLSVWGQRYAGYVNQAQQMGLNSTASAHTYAMGLVERDFLQAQYRAAQQQTQTQAQGAQVKTDFVNAARHIPNVGSATAAGTNGAPTRPALPRNGADLAQLLRSRMTAAGYSGDQRIESR